MRAMLRTVHLSFAAAVISLLAPALALGVKDIDPLHLSMKDCPEEPGCPAVILLDDHELNNEGNRTRYSTRRLIKVFTRDGIDEYSQVEVPGVVGGREVRNLSGRTILPNGKVVKLNNDNVQVKVLRRGGYYLKTKTATFPAVEPGAIIEYTYDVVTPIYTVFTEIPWVIQHEIPVLETKFTLKQGEFQIAWVRAGTQEVDIRHSHPFKNVNYFVAENVPSLPREPFGPPPDLIRARQYFGSPGYMTGWLQAFTVGMARHTSEFISPDGAIKERVGGLTESPSERTKVREIYRFIQERIGPEDAEPAVETKRDHPEDAAGVLALGHGDELERTLLFLSMVKAAGLEPGLLLIVSRDSGVFTPNYPDWYQFDRFAAAVKVGSQWKFYDPAVEHCPYGMLSAEKESTIPNAVLLRVDGGYSLITLPATSSSQNLLKVEASISMDSSGTGTLKVIRTGTGHVDLEHRRIYEDLSEEERGRKIAASFGEDLRQATLGPFRLEGLDSFEDPAGIHYEVSVPSLGTVVEDRVLVSTSAFWTSGTERFPGEERRSDVFFPYARGVRELVTLTVPEGYIVDSLPPPAFSRDGPFFHTTSYSDVAGTISISRVLDVDTIQWPAADYDRLKAFFAAVQAADRQVIVLKKDPP